MLIKLSQADQSELSRPAVWIPVLSRLAVLSWFAVCSAVRDVRSGMRCGSVRVACGSRRCVQCCRYGLRFASCGCRCGVQCCRCLVRFATCGRACGAVALVWAALRGAACSAVGAACSSRRAAVGGCRCGLRFAVCGVRRRLVGIKRPVCTTIVGLPCFLHGVQIGCTEGAAVGPKRDEVGIERPVCTTIVGLPCFLHGVQIGCTEGAAVGPSRGSGPSRDDVVKHQRVDCSLVNCFHWQITGGATEEQWNRSRRAKSSKKVESSARCAPRLSFSLANNTAYKSGTSRALSSAFFARPVVVAASESTRSNDSASVGPSGRISLANYTGPPPGTMELLSSGQVVGTQHTNWSSTFFFARFQHGMWPGNKRCAAVGPVFSRFRASHTIFAPSSEQKQKTRQMTVLQLGSALKHPENLRLCSSFFSFVPLPISPFRPHFCRLCG